MTFTKTSYYETWRAQDFSQRATFKFASVTLIASRVFHAEKGNRFCGLAAKNGVGAPLSKKLFKNNLPVNHLIDTHFFQSNRPPLLHDYFHLQYHSEIFTSHQRL
jgi:hypothetical protein